MPILETTMGMMLLWALGGYLLGSIPFGMVIAKAMGLGSLRDIGSGNIGATNVLRTGNKKAAAMTLLFDAGKGALIVYLARAFAAEDAAQIAGLAAFLGHCFPVWLRFNGGKGVATYFGLLLMLAPLVGVLAGLTWLITAAVGRYSSMAALLSATLAPVIAVLLGKGVILYLCIILAAVIFYRHRGNIDRLRQGTETKIGK